MNEDICHTTLQISLVHSYYYFHGSATDFQSYHDEG
jgi:hypothetical protein